MPADATYAQAATNKKALDALVQLVQNFKFLGDPVAVATPGGYTTFRYMAVMLVFVGIWAVIAGSRLIRGEEGRGSADVLLATPLSRAAILLQKALGFTLATLVIGLGLSVGALVSAPVAHDHVSLGNALLLGLNLSLGALVFGMGALFLSQFLRSAGTAAGAGGGLLLATYLLNALGRTLPTDQQWIRAFSPFFYFDLTKPLVPSYGTNPGALLVLAALAAAFLAGSVALFIRRDLDQPAFPGLTLLFTPKSPPAAVALAQAGRAPAWHSVLGYTLRTRMPSAVWWILGSFAGTLYCAAIVKIAEKPLADFLAGSPAFAKLFGGGDIATNEGFISLVLVAIIPAVVAAFSLTYSNGWVSMLDDPRADVALSVPLPRWRILLESYLALLVPSLLVAAAVWLGILFGAALEGLSINATHALSAGVMLIPLCLLPAAVAYVLATWLRAGVVLGVLGGALGISYVLELVKDLLNLPAWVLNLSIFHLYGTPMTSGINWGAFAGMMLLAALLVGIAAYTFNRSDLARAG